MTKGEVQEAERLALNELDKWNDITGFVQKHTGYYYELQGIIEDAVHVGIQMALNGKVDRKKDGTIKRAK